MKFITAAAIVVFVLAAALTAQGPRGEYKKLNFLTGSWKSTSIKLDSGKESFGESKIQWIINGTWLQWRFTAQLESGPLEVLTLINYHEEKRQYAFYSFNPFDKQPLPHFGNWIKPNVLRLEIIEDSGKIAVDFILKGDGKFEQIHQKILPSGRTEIIRKTEYVRLK